jgi:hypothetical protein
MASRTHLVVMPGDGIGPEIVAATLRGDRQLAIFGDKNTLHSGADFAPYVLLPVIPKQT